MISPHSERRRSPLPAILARQPPRAPALRLAQRDGALPSPQQRRRPADGPAHRAGAAILGLFDARLRGPAARAPEPTLDSDKNTLAVLFADVGSTSRPQAPLGDTTALSQLRGLMQLLQEIATRHDGRLVKTIGECAMFAFGGADAAATAAMDMQDRVAVMPPAAGGGRSTVRIGFHYGPVLCAGDDVFGDTVNTAARLSTLATPGQILLAAGTLAALSAALQEKARRLDALAVKGKTAAVDVCELQWEANDEVTVVSMRKPPQAQRSGPRLLLVHDGRRIEFRMAMTIGRDAHNDIVVLDRMTSRNHARIEKRLDKFVLIDQSANGTFVTIDGQDEIALRREEFILHGNGRLTFGDSARRDPGATVVEFCYEAPLQHAAGG